MSHSEVINWLLSGDVAIQFQVYRDLLNIKKPELQNRIATEGWGYKFLSSRGPNGHWGLRYYQPKWISTHYTLLNLKNLQFPKHKTILETLNKFLDEEKKGADGGIYPISNFKISDVCINGMFLNFASYFGVEESKLESIVDFLIAVHMEDGGFNCVSNRSGASHSSMHSTISVLEGIHEYLSNGYNYRKQELIRIKNAAEEFLLMHKLYKSDKTGEVISPQFTALHYPAYWHFDILRGLEYFHDSNHKYDNRMEDSLELLKSKRKPDGKWPLNAHFPGKTFFNMEQSGKPSRWNTLRAMKVLAKYGGSVI